MNLPLDVGLRGAAAAAAWLFGIGLQLQQAELWALAAYVAMLLGAAALLLASRLPAKAAADSRATLARDVVGVVALAMLGFSSTAWRAHERLQDVLAAHLEGRDLQITGVIAGLPQPNQQGTRFVFDVERAELAGQPVAVPPRVALGWYRGFDGDALIASPSQEIRAGQRWRLPVRLQQPHGTLNPHGFDLELWLFEQGIRASGSVRATAGAVARMLDDGGQHPIDRARQAVRDAIWLRVPDAASAGVLAALAVGDQAAIERDDWDLFRRTGVAHLVSISGVHVTMFAWLAGALVGGLWRCSSRLMLRCPAPLAALWGGVLAAAGYALLAGWGVPAQRTLYMLATLALLRSLGVRWPLPLVLLAAAVVVSAIDPWSLLQPGFWLSFVAVALLMGSQSGMPARDGAATPGWWPATRRTVRSGVRTQAVVTVGLAPLSMVFFQQISLVGFVANLVAIPLVTMVVTPLALLGILWPTLWLPASALVQGLTRALGWLASWPLATWSAAAAPWWAMACGLLAGLLLVMPWPLRLRLLGVPLLLPLLLPPLERPAEGEFEVVAGDVGQGTAVLLRTRGHLLVYDTGPRYSPGSDAGQRVLLPLLRARGETRVDLLVLSHSDSDHVGGAESLLAHGAVQALNSSLPDGHVLLAPGLSHRRCVAGQSWQWDGVHFDMLHPLQEDYVSARKPNALSCVLRVRSQGGSSLLLTGDIESAQEAALVARLGADLHSDVLLVPHHGSRTSSTSGFLQAVTPHTALVQAAYRSRFGHPAPEVQARYRSRDIVLARSDACGAWSWNSADPMASARCERKTAARYWHHRANIETQMVP